MKLSPTPSGKPRRWWFGDTRTVEQQLTGLGPLLDFVAGMTVLDVGCAEGAISIECARRGAKAVYGLEIVPEYVDKARRDGAGLQCAFLQADANTWAPGRDERYDVVLMLAVLQKLSDPSAVCRRIAACCNGLAIIRLPPAGAPVITDPRSGGVPHDIGRAMFQAGFHLMGVTDGPVAEAGKPEYTAYFERALP